MASGKLTVSTTQVNAGERITLTVAIADFSNNAILLSADADPGDGSGWQNVTPDASGDATVEVTLARAGSYTFTLSIDGSPAADGSGTPATAGPITVTQPKATTTSAPPPASVPTTTTSAPLPASVPTTTTSAPPPASAPTSTTTSAPPPPASAPTSTTTSSATAPTVDQVSVAIDPEDGGDHHAHSIQVSTDAKLELTWSTQNATGVRIDPLGSFGALGSTSIPASDASYTIVALGDGGAESAPYLLDVHTHDPKSVVSPHVQVGSGVAKIVFFSASIDGHDTDTAAAGASAQLSFVVSDSTDSATVDGQPVPLSDLPDGHKNGTLGVTIPTGGDPSVTFALAALQGGATADTSSLTLTITPAATPTSTTTAASPAATPTSTTTASSPATTPTSTTTASSPAATPTSTTTASSPAATPTSTTTAASPTATPTSTTTSASPTAPPTGLMAETVFADRLKPDLEVTWPLYQRYTALDTAAQQSASAAGTTLDGAGDAAIVQKVQTYRDALAANLARAHEQHPAEVTADLEARRARRELFASAQLFQQKSDALGKAATVFLDAKSAYATAAGDVRRTQGDIQAKQDEPDQPSLGLNFSFWDVVKLVAEAAGLAAVTAFTGGGAILAAAGAAAVSTVVDQAKGMAMGAGKQALELAKDDITGAKAQSTNAAAAIADLQQKLAQEQGKLKDAGDSLSHAADALAQANSDFADALGDLDPKRQAYAEALAKLAQAGAGDSSVDSLFSMYAALQEREALGTALFAAMDSRVGTQAQNLDGLIHTFSDAKPDPTAPRGKGFAGGIVDSNRKLFQGASSLDEVHALGDQLKALKAFRVARDAAQQQLPAWQAQLDPGAQPAPPPDPTPAPGTPDLPPAPPPGTTHSLIRTPVYADRLRPDLDATWPLLQKWRGLDAAAQASAKAAGTSTDGASEGPIAAAVNQFKADLQANIAKAHRDDANALTIDAEVRRSRTEFKAATGLVRQRYDAFNAKANAFLRAKSAFQQAAGAVRLDKGTIEAQQLGQDLNTLGIHIDLWLAVKSIGETVGKALLAVVTNGGNVVAAVTQAGIQSVVDQAKALGDQIKPAVLAAAKSQITGAAAAADGISDEVQKLKAQLAQDQGKLATQATVLGDATDAMSSALVAYKDSLQQLEPKRADYSDALEVLSKAGAKSDSPVKIGGLLAMYAQLQLREVVGQELASTMPKRVGTAPENADRLIHRFLDAAEETNSPHGKGFVCGIVDSDAFVYQGCDTLDEVRTLGEEMKELKEWLATRPAQAAQLDSWRALLDELAGERPDVAPVPATPKETTTLPPVTPGKSNSQVVNPIDVSRVRSDLDATGPLFTQWKSFDAAAQALAQAAGTSEDGARDPGVTDAVAAFKAAQQNKQPDNPAVVTVAENARRAAQEYQAAGAAAQAKLTDLNKKAATFFKAQSDYAAAAGKAAQDQGAIDAQNQQKDLGGLGLHFDLWESVKTLGGSVKDAVFGAVTSGGNLLSAGLSAAEQSVIDQAKAQGTTAGTAVLGLAKDQILGTQSDAGGASDAMASLQEKLSEDQGKLKTQATQLKKATTSLDKAASAYKDAAAAMEPKRANYQDALAQLASSSGKKPAGSVKMDGVLGLFGRLQERETTASQLESAMDARTATSAAAIDDLVHKFADVQADAQAPRLRGLAGGIVDSDRYVYQGADKLEEVRALGLQLKALREWRAGRQAQKDQLAAWQSALDGLISA